MTLDREGFELRSKLRAIAPVQPADHEWRHDAVCAGMDPDLFFPPGPGVISQADLQAARRVCASCTVAAECLGDALTRWERYGIRGGLTPHERRSHARNWQLFICAECGEVTRSDKAGYATYCQPCRRIVTNRNSRESLLRNTTADPYPREDPWGTTNRKDRT